MLIPYWHNRKLDITWYRVKRRNNKLTVTIIPMFKDKELGKHCHSEWFFKRWWFIDLPFRGGSYEFRQGYNFWQRET